jgi:hypothetical protein
LYNGTRWFWVNGGERIDTLYRDWINLDALNEKFYIDSPTGNSGSIPGSIRTRTSSRIRPRRRHGRILHRRRRPDLLSPSRQHRSAVGKLESARQHESHRSRYLNREFSYGDRSGKRVDLPVSAADRAASLGYEYDGYEKPPKPVTLTTDQAAERDRVYHELHEQALGGSNGGPHRPMPSGARQQ